MSASGPEPKVCIDCAAIAAAAGAKVSRRKVIHPGPRCGEHHRAKKNERKDVARERRWKAVYGISGDEYRAILEEQGGKCFLCERAYGLSRALCVDHCHKTGMVRGCLCSRCNEMLGHARDSIDFFNRCISYLTEAPAVRAIGVRIVPNFEENQ